jgi:transposase
VLEVPWDACPDCQVPLVDPVVPAHYQTDLPPVVPVVTHFNIHGGTCPRCRRYPQGRHPERLSDATGACANPIGPVALTRAAATRCAGARHRLGVPYRKSTDFFGTYFGLAVSPGTLVRAEQRLAQKARPTFELLVEALRRCGIVHGDETGWRLGRVNAWLWVFSSQTVTVYAIRTSRGHEVPEEVLGPDFEGVLVVDGWSAYDVLGCKKGRCLGHIARRCRAGMERQPNGAEAAELEGLLGILARGLDLADRHGQLAQEYYWAEMRQWETDFDNWVLRDAEPAGEEVRRLRKHLLGHHDEFLRFLLEPGVPATNNHAERRIRPAVPVLEPGGCNKALLGACVPGILASLMVSLQQQGKRFVDLALRLWREADAGAIDLEGLPAAPKRGGPAPVRTETGPLPTAAFAPSG